MKEIEEQILARKDELKAAAPKKGKAPEKAVSAAEISSEEGGESASDEDVLANFDENFEEFTPAEE